MIRSWSRPLGHGGWTGSDDNESAAALDRAVELGCNSSDTALAYGKGRSDRLLGALVHRHRGHRLYVATTVTPEELEVAGPRRHARAANMKNEERKTKNEERNKEL